MNAEISKGEQPEDIRQILISADIFSAQALADRIRQTKIAKMRAGELLPEVIEAALKAA